MGAAVIQAIHDRGYYSGKATADQNCNGRCKANQYRPFHLIRLNFLAKEFRSTAYHQASNKHRQNGKGKHTVKAASHAAENNLTKLHQQHSHHTAKRRVAVMHGVYRAVGGCCSEGCPGRGCRNAEAGLLAFHIAASLFYHRGIDCTILCKLRCTDLLTDSDATQGNNQTEEHCHKDCDTLLLVLYRRAECEAQCRRNQKNGNHFNQIGKGIGVFQRMCRVDAHVAAAVGAGLLDCDLTGCRTHWYELLGDDLCIRKDFAIYSDGCGV